MVQPCSTCLYLSDTNSEWLTDLPDVDLAWWHCWRAALAQSAVNSVRCHQARSKTGISVRQSKDRGYQLPWGVGFASVFWIGLRRGVSFRGWFADLSLTHWAWDSRIRTSSHALTQQSSNITHLESRSVSPKSTSKLHRFALEMLKNHWRPGLCPGPHWEAYDAPHAP
jgi:hypothetical protein